MNGEDDGCGLAERGGQCRDRAASWTGVARIVQLVTDGAWGMALIVVMLGVALLLLIYFDGLIGRLLDRIFPSGVRSATPPRDDRKPLVRRLSLPAGLVLGVFLALFGLADTILGLL